MELKTSSVRLISLKQDTFRRELLVKHGFPKDVISNYMPATDFRDKFYSDAIDNIHLKYGPYHYGRALSASEVGCALSHKEAYQSLFERGAELGLVLEDDIRLGNEFIWADVEKIFQSLFQTLQRHQAFVVHLGCTARDLARFQKIDGNLRAFEKKAGGLWNGHAYIISRPAMSILRSETKVKRLADDWAAVSGLGVDVYLHEPGLFAQDRTLKSNLTRFKKHNRAPLPKNPFEKIKYGIKKRVKSIVR